MTENENKQVKQTIYMTKDDMYALKKISKFKGVSMSEAVRTLIQDRSILKEDNCEW